MKLRFGLLASLSFALACGTDVQVDTENQIPEDNTPVETKPADEKPIDDKPIVIPPDTKPDEVPLKIEIAGTWDGNFGEHFTVTSTAWGNTTMIEFDNTKNVAITQSSPTDEWNPSKFNRYVWTEPTNDTFFYCQINYGLDSADAARSATEVADATDPANGGCGSYPWSKMTRAPQ